MPSEQTILALEALRTAVDGFRSSLAVTADQLRGFLDAASSSGGGESARAAATLGTFASGRIDFSRFAAITSDSTQDGAEWLPAVQRAITVLEELAARGDDLFVVQVDRGDSLQRCVDDALAEAGRAFGAARVAELARSSRYAADAHDRLLESFPYRRWSAAERALAPPLLIDVHGEDLVAGGLSAYLDGSQKMVLVVEGPAPAAALVRLISPGVFVMQTADAAELARIGAQRGPAVAAVMPDGAAMFAHTPAEGERGALDVTHLPDAAPRRRLGAVSTFQQEEDLRQLRMLIAHHDTAGAGARDGAAAPSVAEVLPGASVATSTNGSTPVGAAQPNSDPAGMLAGWLLQQVDLSDL